MLLVRGNHNVIIGGPFIKYRLVLAVIQRRCEYTVTFKMLTIAIIAASYFVLTETQCAEEPLEEIDEGYLESLRTEIHPKDPPEVSKRVLFRHKVVLGKAGERDLQGDVFTPKRIPKEPRPAIVFLHGGSWKFGSPSQFHYHAAYLADKYDFFAVSVDYRLSGRPSFPPRSKTQSVRFAGFVPKPRSSI